MLQLYAAKLSYAPKSALAVVRAVTKLHQLEEMRREFVATEKLYTNLDTVMEAIAKAKPAATKGTYFKSATIATTMGPGIRLNTLKYGV